MSVRVRIEIPTEYDPAVITEALGEPALPLDTADRVLAPFITINGRVHAPSSHFLRHQMLARPNQASVRRLASDLAGWIEFLCNQCDLAPHEDVRDPVLQATEDHFAAYYRRRQYGLPDEVLTSEGWGRAVSAIKRLYEYLERRYQHQPPFQITRFSRPDGGSGTTLARYQPRRRNTGSAGVPLTPIFAEHLLMGALRVDLNGHQDDYKAADRDHAIISLGLATGVRRHNLANVTIYELPRPSDLPITTMRVADQITKGEAGGDALAFTHRLQTVRDYVAGSRADIAARTRYRPDDPLTIVAASTGSVSYAAPANTDEVTTTSWSELDAATRRRLVHTDGSSPVVFLNEFTGAPLAYSSFQHTVAGARDFVRARITPDFPDQLRVHDLRHTYAVHLTVAIYRGVIAAAMEPHRRDDWTVDHIAAAVELVRFSLGHASAASTRLYIQTAHRFLNIPTDQFIGAF